MDEKEVIDIQEDKNNSAKSKYIKIGLIAALLVAIIGGYLWWNNLRNYISTDNANVAGDIVALSPKVSGRVESLTVQEGDVVQVGQTIAELDTAQLKINLEQAQAALALNQANYDKLPDDLKSAQAGVEKAQQTVAITQAQLTAAQVAAADSQRNLSQDEQLQQSGAISQEALTTATSANTKAQAAAEAAQASLQANQAALVDAQAKMNSLDKTGAAIYLAQLQQAQAAFDSAQLNLANSVIKAPVNGTVVEVAVKVGENVSAGQAILSIGDLDNTWISANIEEGKYGRLKVGQAVKVQIDAYPGTTFDAQVSELGGATQSTFALIPTTNSSGNYTKVTQYLSCKITVDKKGLVLKPGMSAVVDIHTGH
jgi:membrane fusion protein (multidrug efflux system)